MQIAETGQIRKFEIPVRGIARTTDFATGPSYRKLLNKPLGLLINFHKIVLKNGIHWLVPRDGDGP